jgi:molecular chaperone DnaK
VYEVKSTAGDTHLGGDDLDQVVIDWLVAGFREEHGIDLARDRVAVARLKDAAEKAKCELSSALETHINLPFIASNDSGPVHLDVILGRARFESLVAPLIDRTVDPCRQALADAHFESGQVEEVLLVGGSTRIPLVQQTVRRIFNREPNRSVNQDEVVAMGAALHAGILQGAVDEILLLDVTPLSLGIETFGGVMTKLIERNTTVPTRRSQTFSTAIDNQNAVSVHVLQGEREMAGDNRSLARFDLVGIPPAPRGVPQVDVVFDIDANGIVSVSATDLGTGRKQQIQVHASGNLSEVEISRLITDAEARREEDLEKKRSAEIRNRAELMLMNVTTALAEYGGSVSEEERGAIEGALADVRQALEDAATERLTALTDTLAQRSHVIADQLYSR